MSKSTELNLFDEGTWETRTQPIRNEAERVKVAALKIKIDSHDKYVAAADGLLDLAERIETVEKERDAAIGPIKKGVKLIETWFRTALKPYGEAEEHLRSELGRYAAECEAKRDDKLLKAASEEKREKATALISSAEDELAPKIAGIGYRGGFEYNVVDFDALPVEFKKVVADEVKIAAVVKRDGLSAKIPGVVVKDGRSVIVSTTRREK